MNPDAIKDGGPAFPETRWSDGHRQEVQWCGMTLRDYFAAKALQGFIANKNRPTHFQPDDDAAYCFAIADAMLAARKS